MNDFQSIIMGDSMSVGAFLGYLAIAILTSLIILSFRGNKKRKSSAKSPEDFSPEYLLTDNRKRILSSLLVMAFSIRFSENVIQADMTPWGAALIGGSVHLLAGFIKNIFKAGKQ